MSSLDLSQAETTLLQELFLQSLKGTGAEAVVFRANNYQHIEAIDRLKSDGYIREENRMYFVSLVALPDIGLEESKEILVDCERLFAELKKIYLANPRNPTILLDDLAKLTRLNRERTAVVLAYALEGAWWGGHSTDLSESNREASVTPSESILKFNSYGDVIAQLRGWLSQRIEARKNYKGNSNAVLADALGFGRRQQRQVTPAPASWIDGLPPIQRTLYLEILSARSYGLLALTAMGARAVIDTVCVELVGDVGSFDKKLECLLEGRHISSAQRDVLASAIELGSAAAHRSHRPGEEDVDALLEIVEHLVKAIYILPPTSERLRSNTPPRPKRQEK